MYGDGNDAKARIGYNLLVGSPLPLRGLPFRMHLEAALGEHEVARFRVNGRAESAVRAQYTSEIVPITAAEGTSDFSNILYT